MDVEVLKTVSETIKQQISNINYEDIEKSFKRIKKVISVSDILNPNTDIINIQDNIKGLYFIEARFKNKRKKSWDNFILQWKNFKEKTPLIVEKRKDKLKLYKNRFQPLYLGKSQNIKKRLNEHFFCESKKDDFLKSTSALRLKQFFKFYNNSKLVTKMEFRIKYLKLEITDCLLYELEKKLRNNLNCLIGKN